jgi:hypothetical protein
MNLIRLLTILFALSSCARVPIVDAEFCGDKGAFGARCTYFIQDKKRSMTEAEWEKKRVGWVCTSPETFSNWKKSLLKLCDSNKACYFYSEEVEKATTSLGRIESLSK